MLDGLKKRLREHEGVIPHMYLDTLGYVTAAVGHLLSTVEMACHLPWVHPDGTRASIEEVTAEFNAVLALDKAKLPSYYEQRTKLRLLEDGIDQTLDADVEIMTKGVTHYFPNFSTFPEPAQEALLDMAFQLGPSGLVNKFPNLTAAVKEQKWDLCATRCHRAGIQEWRNKATVDLFSQAVTA